MTTNPAPVAPSWLVPGVEVLVIRGHREDSVTWTRVARIRGWYFTVEHPSCEDLRFSLDSQEHRSRYMWGSSIRAIQFDSDEARKLWEADRRHRLISCARDACVTWTRYQNRDNRLAAIEALEAVED
jgi:hypothetical protein